MVTCTDCKGIAAVGGANFYDCLKEGSVWNKYNPEDQRLIVEERREIECPAFDAAEIHLRMRMKEMVEVGVTKVYGNGSVQIPKDVRDILEIKDGDKPLAQQKLTLDEIKFQAEWQGQYHVANSFDSLLEIILHNEL